MLFVVSNPRAATHHSDLRVDLCLPNLDKGNRRLGIRSCGQLIFYPLMGRPCVHRGDRIAACCKADQSMAPGNLVAHTLVETLTKDFLATCNFITECLDQSKNGILYPGIAWIVTVTNKDFHVRRGVASGKRAKTIS